jgi:hypothetical protein
LFSQYHFAPTGKSKKQHLTSTAATLTTTTTSSLYQRAIQLFRNVPILYVLCYEVFIGQVVSTLWSYMFITYTKQSIPLDHERASHTGNVYGRINFMSGLLQFAILPYILGQRRQQRRYDDSDPNNLTNRNHKTDESSHSQNLIIVGPVPVDWYWLLLPSLLGIAGVVMVVVEPTYRFDVVTISFSRTKILEYSLRVALVERVRRLRSIPNRNIFFLFI